MREAVEEEEEDNWFRRFEESERRMHGLNWFEGFEENERRRK